MLTFVSIVHVLLCVFMIFVILLQPGKDAGMGSALGGGAATSAFGGRGAVTFLTKVTAVCAIGFFVTALGLSFVGLRSSVAVGGDETPAAPAAPAQTPGATGLEKPSEGGGAAAPAAPAEAPKGTEGVPAEKLPETKPAPESAPADKAPESKAAPAPAPAAAAEKQPEAKPAAAPADAPKP